MPLRVSSWLIGLGLGGLLAACSRPAVEAPPTKGEIWAAIQPPAQLYRIDLAFIYALVAAESAFDPQARNGEARELLQLKPAAGAAGSAAPSEPTGWAGSHRSPIAGAGHLGPFAELTTDLPGPGHEKPATG